MTEIGDILKRHWRVFLDGIRDGTDPCIKSTISFTFIDEGLRQRSNTFDVFLSRETGGKASHLSCKSSLVLKSKRNEQKNRLRAS